MSVARYYPFSGKKGRLRLGLSPIPIADWIQYEDDFADRIRDKKILINSERKLVLDSFKESTIEQQELSELVIEYLQKYQNKLFEFEEDSIFSVKENVTYTISDYKNCPFELISYLVPDDYCLLEESGDDYKLVAASVCAPTWWELSAKMGKPLISIHAPIANLEEKIGPMIRHFLKNLTYEDCYQRSNWFLYTKPGLCVFPSNFNMYEDLINIGSENIEDHLYLRSERQTFRKLRESGNIAFGIKVYVAPISIVEEHPAIAEDLIEALSAMNAEQKQALAIDVIEKPLRNYLEKIVTK